MIILKERSDTIYVWRHVNLNRSRALIFFTLLALSFMLFIINKYPFAQVGLTLIPLSYGLGVYTYRKIIAWNTGSMGEKKVVKELMRLDDRYFLLNNVIIPPNRGDVDHVVLGPNGLFVIETKTVGDTVKCDGDAWSRFKKGRRGFSYPISFGNPGKQIKRNAKTLKDLLLKHEFEVFKSGAPHIWVHAIVVFTNEEVELEVKNPTVAVLRVSDLVGNVLSAPPSEKPYSEGELRRMGDVILSECG